MIRRILLLGGTTEARILTKQLLADPSNKITYSLAGALGKDAEASFRKRMPHTDFTQLDIRIGGFGGVKGLVHSLESQKFDLVIDATHPFAQSMSQNAIAAVEQVGSPIVRYTRPAWRKQPDDRWTQVDTLASAADRVPQGSRVFLAVGRQSVMVFSKRSDCWFLIRSIAPSDISQFGGSLQCIRSLPEASIEAEISLFQRFDIDCLVTKNSGSDIAFHKVEAARRLGVDVIMIKRPELPSCREFCSLHDIVSWIGSL